MPRFAQEYSLNEISRKAVDQFSWGHNIVLMYGLSNKEERAFYIQKVKDHDWSRNILSMQIEFNLYKREGKAVTNFNNKLSPSYADLEQLRFIILTYLIF